MQTNAMAGNTWLPDKNQTGWKWECLSQVFEYKMCNVGRYILREGFRKKKPYFFGAFAKPGGGGSARVVKKPYCFFEKSIFSESMQNHSRTPKTCFTLGLESFGHIYSYLNSFESGTLWLPWWSPRPFE